MSTRVSYKHINKAIKAFSCFAGQQQQKEVVLSQLFNSNHILKKSQKTRKSLLYFKLINL